MDFNLESLLDLHKLKKMYEIHLAQIGISSALIGVDGKKYIVTGWQHIESMFHPGTSEYSRLCHLAYEDAMGKIRNGQKLVYYSCPLGLMNVVVPIVINNNHIANFVKGHFLFGKPDGIFLEKFRKQVKEFGFDENRYIDALNHLPVFYEDKMNVIMGMTLIYSEMLEKMGTSFMNEKSARLAAIEAHKRLETEIAMRKAEADKLTQIIEANAIATFVINSDGFVTHWNKTCELMTGYRSTEIIGTRRHQEVFYPSKRPLLADLILKGTPISEIWDLYGDKVKKSYLNPDTYEGEDYFQEMGNMGKIIFFTAAPLKDSDSKIAGAICTLQDITDKRNTEHGLRQSEERYRHLFESANDAIILLKDGQIKDCNQKALFLFGYPREKLIGLSPVDISPEFQPGGENSSIEIKRKSEIVYQDNPLIFEWRFMRKDGSFFDAGVSISKIIISDHQYSLSIIRDITDTKHLIAILRDREHELDEKNLYLEKVNSALKASLDHRDVERRALEESILSNMKRHVFPYISELSRCAIGDSAKTYLNIIETNLNSLVSPYSNRIFSKYIDLTPTEIRIADLIKSGMNTKGIAETLSLSPSSVQWHRKNIRTKLGLNGKKINLHTFLTNLT